MKRLLALLFSLALVQLTFAAWHENIPQTIEQPDGKVINCFATGDEFYHWLHDADGYTIVLDPEDGYFYYGVQSGDKVIPSRYVVGKTDPSRVGLQKNARISETLYYERRAEYQKSLKSSNSAPTRGIVNSICIYISFADDSVFTAKRSQYKSIWSSVSSPSVSDFFSEISYRALTINAHHYPVSPDTVNICYVDVYPRKYYLPRTNSNPDGYPDSEKGQREHAMLRRAIEFIQDQVPDDVNLDMNNDNTVDNISFVIRGNSSAWSDLLWPHAWGLSSFVVTLKGLRVRSYFLTMENGFGVGTFCHELGHVFGAPDLYHYDQKSTAPKAVGGWCLMDASSNPPQSICGFLKFKYNKWIPVLPEITESGVYTLLPLSNPDRNLYKIKSPYSASEYFVLEFRKREGRYEIQAPGSGLVVYRINPGAGNGNADGPPDEVYAYRPGGYINSEGTLGSAAFGASNRKEFNDQTNPFCYLWANGSGGKGGLDLKNITLYEDSLTFEVTIDPRFPPSDLVYTTGNGFVDLDWNPCLSPGFAGYNVYRNGVLLTTSGVSYYKDNSVQEGLPYSYYITGTFTGENAGESQPSNTITYTPKPVLELPYTEGFESPDHGWMIKGYIEGFQWGNAASLEIKSSNETNFIGANSYAAGEGLRCRDYAISPRINLQGRTSAILDFDYSQKRLQQFGTLKLLYRQSRYQPWVLLADLNPTGIGLLYTWRKYSIELPPAALASETQIGFQYDDGTGVSYGAAIDNVVLRDPSSGIREEPLENIVSVFPNPAEKELTVRISGMSQEQVIFRILSADGKEMRKLIRNNPADLETINLEGFPSGLYHLLMETGEKVIVRNFIKQD